MTEEPPQKKFNLVCTECDHTLAKNIDEDMTKHMQAGYCNWGACNGKLEWKPVE